MIMNVNMAVPLADPEALLFPRVDIHPFNDYNQLLHSAKTISFQINKAQCLIQSPIVKTRKYALYSGLLNSRKVLIKVFAAEEDYFYELSILKEYRSEELIDFCNQKLPIMVLEFTDGTAFSQIMRDCILGGHLEQNPQDRALVDTLWPNYKEISQEEFQKITSLYLDNNYVVKIDDKKMIYEDLLPENVLITPDLKVKVIDYTKLKSISSDDWDNTYLNARTQDKLIDSFYRFKKALEDVTLKEIRNGKIPEEILFNPNFDSAISQIDWVSHIEEMFSYDHSIATIQEENLFDSYNFGKSFLVYAFRFSSTWNGK